MDVTEKSKINKYLPAGIGALATLGMYKYLRTPKNAIIPESLNNFTIGVSYGAKKLRKLLGKAYYSHDINFSKVNDANAQYRGLLYTKNVDPSIKAVGEASINGPKVTDLFLRVGTEKEKFPDIPGIGHYFINHRTLPEVLTDFGVDTTSFSKMNNSQLSELFNKIETKHGLQFIKPIAGQSMGAGTSSVYAPLQKVLTHKKAKVKDWRKLFKETEYIPNPEGAKHIQQNPNDYMLQSYIGEVPERRIHILDDKIIDEVRRFGPLEGTKTKAQLLTFSEKSQLEADLKKMYATLGIDTKKTHAVFGLDAARDKNTGKIKFIELNPNSGFLFNITDMGKKDMLRPWEYSSSNRIYKAITGRDMSGVAALKALTAGGAASVAATTAVNHITKTSEESKLPIYSGIGALGGLAVYKLLKGKNPHQFYHVVAENTKAYSQQNSKKLLDKVKHALRWGNIKHISMSELDKINKNDIAYFDVPEQLLHNTPLNTGITINNNQKLMQKLEDKVQSIDNLSLLPQVHTSEELVTRLSEMHPSGWYIKPRYGARSEGFHLNSNQLNAGAEPINIQQDIIDKFRSVPKKPHVSPQRKLLEYIKNPSNYVVQKLIPGNKEYRVTAYNGKILSTHYRHNLAPILSTSDMEVLKNEITLSYNKLKKIAPKSDNLYLGYDIKFDAQNKPVILDINSQEGYFWRYPGKLYRATLNKSNLHAAAAISSTPVIAGVTLDSFKKKDYI